MTTKKRLPQCVNCKERNENGIYDMYGRFWCEDCLICILGNMEPGRGQA